MSALVVGSSKVSEPIPASSIAVSLMAICRRRDGRSAEKVCCMVAYDISLPLAVKELQLLYRDPERES